MRPDTIFIALSRIFYHIAHLATSASLEYRSQGVSSPLANERRILRKATDANAIRQFLEVLWRSNDLFNTTMHQDAHEFLNFILNKACDDLNEPQQQSEPAHGETSIHRLFQGTLTNETRCLTCESVSLC